MITIVCFFSLLVTKTGVFAVDRCVAVPVAPPPPISAPVPASPPAKGVVFAPGAPVVFATK